MSMTGNENESTQAAPSPVDEETDGTNSEAEQESELVRTPPPGMATHPTIKNN